MHFKRSKEPTLLHVKIIKLRVQIKYKVCSRIEVKKNCGILKVQHILVMSERFQSVNLLIQLLQ